MIDSPSIVPDLVDLVELVEQYAMADDFDEWNLRSRLDEKTKSICEGEPTLMPVMRALVIGVTRIRQQRSNAKKSAETRSGNNRARNIEMAAECIKRRHDPAYSDMDDSTLMHSVGNLPRFKVTSRSGAISAVKDGLSDPLNQSRMRQSGQRGKTDRRRSIFES